MSEATPEPEAEPSLWELDPEEFGPADIEGNPPADPDDEASA